MINATDTAKDDNIAMTIVHVYVNRHSGKQ